MDMRGKVLRTRLIENHRILHAGTTPLLHVNPEHLPGILRLAQQRFDFLSRVVRKLDYWFSGDVGVRIHCNSH